MITKVGYVFVVIGVILLTVPTIAYQVEHIDASNTRIFVDNWRYILSGLVIFVQGYFFIGE